MVKIFKFTCPAGLFKTNWMLTGPEPNTGFGKIDRPPMGELLEDVIVGVKLMAGG